MKKSPLGLWFLSAVIVVSAAGIEIAQAQTIIYRETFGNNSPMDPVEPHKHLTMTFGESTTGWQVTNADVGDVTNTVKVISGDPTSFPMGLENIGTGNPSENPNNGFIYTGGYWDTLLYRTLPATPSGGAIGQLLLSDYSSIQFTWNQAGSNGVRLVVQIDEGGWYASSTVYAGVLNAGTNSLTFNSLASNWLDVLPYGGPTDGFLSLGSAPSSGFSSTSKITGFGYYLMNDWAGYTGTKVLDTFTVTVTSVPEPTAAGLLGLVVLSFVCVRRRKFIA